MSASPECREVAAYLERFGASSERFDVAGISDHVKICSSCYETMQRFFRSMDVSDERYLDETLDDLTLALYNLVKAIMKESPQPDGAERGNVRFVQEPGSSRAHVEEGREMIDDVQDYVGSDLVRGGSMEGIRDLLDRSGEQIDFAFLLLDRAIELGGRHSLDCANLKGILHLERDQFEQAERCFRLVITHRDGDLYTRKVRVHAMNNLAYVCVARDRVGEAIDLARRSKILAEETGLDPFASSFGLIYFHLLRDQAGDRDAARRELKEIVDGGNRRDDLVRSLSLPSNAAVRELLEASGLDRQIA